ncbi:MAG: helix-turn-helix transcriptional regulator [Magnetococcales bacterium]|nr:helix-turn-helix transcriptional regulator [Magnetococcales bacterium]
MDIGGTIRQCRHVRKMTLVQLANSTGISVSHLCLLEKNKREPSLTSITAIANSLGIPLSVLVFLASEKKEIGDLDAKHIDALTKNIISLMHHVNK